MAFIAAIDAEPTSMNLCRLLPVLATATVLTPVISGIADGGLIDEPSWTAESEDGRYRLVTLQLDPEWSDPNDALEIELKARYGQSGIYYGEEFLWSIPYHPPAYQVYFTPDGDHVLLAITDTEHTISNIPVGAALNFYHRDKEPDIWHEHEVTWGYAIKLLIYKFAGSRPWNEWKGTAYDPIAGTFTVETNQSEEFVFDVRTGKKIRSSSAWNNCVAIFLVVVPLLTFAFGRIGLLKSNVNSRPTFWQVSTRELLFLATVAAMLLAIAKFSVVLAAVTTVVGIVGGGVAQFRSRGRRSFLLGIVLAVYGMVVGLVVFGTIGETLLWRTTEPQNLLAVVLMLAGCPVVGALVGGLVGGAIAGRLETRVAQGGAEKCEVIAHITPGRAGG